MLLEASITVPYIKKVCRLGDAVPPRAPTEMSKREAKKRRGGGRKEGYKAY